MFIMDLGIVLGVGMYLRNGDNIVILYGIYRLVWNIIN